LDFWDLTAVILRRWRIALPLLLITIGATGLVAFTVKPDYVMTSYVQLIPAKVAPTDNPASASLRNPWNQLGLNTLGQASIYATQDQKFLDALKDSGHTDNFTLTMTYPNPIVTVEVVGSGPGDARDTTQLVIDRLRQSAESLQKGSGVSDPDMIATQRLDQGLNLLPSRSKVKRAILAVAAAGLVMVAAGVVGFDALARRRSRNRQERDQADASTPLESTETGATNGKEAPSLSTAPTVYNRHGNPVNEMMTRPIPVVPPARSADQTVSPAGTVPSASMEQTAIVKRTAKPVKHPPAVKSSRSPTATYWSAFSQDPANGEEHDAVTPPTNGDAPADASDVRVVLQPKRVGGENGDKSS
jgi:hypothetical protein